MLLVSPAPIADISFARKRAMESSNAARPKSAAWLFARLTALIRAAVRTRIASSGARNE